MGWEVARGGRGARLPIAGEEFFYRGSCGSARHVVVCVASGRSRCTAWLEGRWRVWSLRCRAHGYRLQSTSQHDVPGTGQRREWCRACMTLAWIPDSLQCQIMQLCSCVCHARMILFRPCLIISTSTRLPISSKSLFRNNAYFPCLCLSFPHSVRQSDLARCYLRLFYKPRPRPLP